MWVPGVLAMDVAGFLFWSFPPARILWGGRRKRILGIAAGVISIQASWIALQLLWARLILLRMFIVDATFTLIRRLVCGDKIYETHRSYAYRFASRKYGKHLSVTLAVGPINIVWLLPVALCVSYFGMDDALGLVIAYSPLVMLAVKFHAGEIEINQAFDS